MESLPNYKGRAEGIENDCRCPQPLPEGLALSSHAISLRRRPLATQGMIAEVLFW